MIEEKNRNKYLETDEIIREAYNEYVRKFNARPTQAQIAHICGINRKTINIHLKGNPFFMGPEQKKVLKKRVEKEGQIEFCLSYKRIVWGHLLHGEKLAISVQNLRMHGPLKKIAASTLSNHLRTLVEDGVIKRAKKHDYYTLKQTWHYWKPEKDDAPEPQETDETRISALEADIERIKKQHRELRKEFEKKKTDSRLKKLEAMRDVEQANYDVLEQELKKWNDEETKIRKDVF